MNEFANHKSFPSKILIFGEYTLMYGADAVSIPYKSFSGNLEFTREFDSKSKQSNEILKSFHLYCKKNQMADKWPFSLDLTTFENDIKKGLIFNSTIPNGYGLGSSGALIAALYYTYGKLGSMSKRDAKAEGLTTLKNNLAMMESFFHGSSSGLDPLCSFLGKPLLVKSGEFPEVTTFKPFIEPLTIFLINTRLPRQTAPLVAYFKQQMQKAVYKNHILHQYMLANNSCIQHLTQGNIPGFTRQIKSLSEMQLDSFHPMIPDTLKPYWEKGLNQDVYLKLCGAGGGGYMLGFTRDIEAANHLLSDFKLIKVSVN